MQRRRRVRGRRCRCVGRVGGCSPASESVDPDAIPADIEVCELLTDEQVATVLAGHEGGIEAASGQQLFGDETRSYKCGYDVE